MHLINTLSRVAATTALVATLSLGGAATAGAEPAGAPGPGGWQGEGGLALNEADNAKVDTYLKDAEQAERSISPQVRAAAR
ncbi:hypothetical protein AB0C76_31230 [Kitasatospora sp. NPDC048722]|uniref:hypothetical protein n=1 Tax=Kitasatospora sp. NPDC048722 TaxID=3155639 RepID=UPI00340A1491